MIKVPSHNNFDSIPQNNTPSLPDNNINFPNDLDDDMGNGDFDSNMDNGDLESENDPKKEIQQLTGKLSQALRQYNNNQDKPDTELNKYVAGMIIPQASKSLTNDDKDEVIKKINTNSSDNQDFDENDDTVNEMMDSLMNYEKNRNNLIMNKNKPKNNPFISNR